MVRSMLAASHGGGEMPTPNGRRTIGTPRRRARGLNGNSRAAGHASPRGKTSVKSKLEVAMGRRIRQAKRAAARVVRAAGAVLTTAKKRIQRAAARQRLKKKARRAGAVLKAAGKAAVIAGLAAGATRGVHEMRSS